MITPVRYWAPGSERQCHETACLSARAWLRSALLAVLILVYGSSSLRAELKWDVLKAELSPNAADAFIETKFPFMNTGKTAVEIESVQSSCGCTIPTLAKATYAPGERGEVSARFMVGDRRGVNTKTIMVAVKGERKPTVLTLVVTIPEPAKLSPGVLIWETGEPSMVKTISVEALPNQPLQVLNVTSKSPNFTASVATIQENKQYRISVIPGSTDTPAFVLLSIETLLMGHKKVIPAYVQIKPHAK